MARRLAQTLSAVLWNRERLLRALPVTASCDAVGFVTKDVACVSTGAASLQDYAYVARGFWHAAGQWQDDDLGVVARDIAIAGWQCYFDIKIGGWHLASHDEIQFADPQVALMDHSRLSPAALLLQTSVAMLGEPPGDSVLRIFVVYAVAHSSKSLVNMAYSYANHVLALLDYQALQRTERK